MLWCKISEKVKKKIIITPYMETYKGQIFRIGHVIVL